MNGLPVFSHAFPLPPFASPRDRLPVPFTFTARFRFTPSSLHHICVGSFRFAGLACCFLLLRRLRAIRRFYGSALLLPRIRRAWIVALGAWRIMNGENAALDETAGGFSAWRKTMAAAAESVNCSVYAAAHRSRRAPRIINKKITRVHRLFTSCASLLLLRFTHAARRVRCARASPRA